MDYSFAQVVQFSLYDLFGRVIAILPDVIGAIIIILIGFIIAPVFGGIVRRIVDLLKVDAVAEKVGLHDILKKTINCCFPWKTCKMVLYYCFPNGSSRSTRMG
jgi:hypothetical protein